VRDLLNADPAIKAIVSSGYAEDPVMSRPADYGFSGRLIKPYRMNELSKVLEALFGRPV
jgi:hypothetical protein